MKKSFYFRKVNGLKIPYNSYFYYPASISCSGPDRMNTPEKNCLQNITNFLTSLTLSGSPNRKKQFDISLKKEEGKKKGGNPSKFNIFFAFFVVQCLQLIDIIHYNG